MLDVCPVDGEEDAPGEDLQPALPPALLTGNVRGEVAGLSDGLGEEGGPDTAPAGRVVRPTEEGERAGEDGVAGGQTHNQKQYATTKHKSNETPSFFLSWPPA